MAANSILGDYAKAKQMVGRLNSSLCKMSQVLHVPIPSEYLGDIRGAITELLNEELKIYSSELNGVPVAFDEKTAKLTENYGTLISAQPYIHCDIHSDFIVFKPEVGGVLNAVVSKIAPDVIGCLVHGCFYATIVKTDVDARRVSKINVGSKIKLVVTKLGEDGNGMLEINGKLSAPRSRKGEAHSGMSATIDSGIDDSHASGSPVHLVPQKRPPTPNRGDNSMLNASAEDQRLAKQLFCDPASFMQSPSNQTNVASATLGFEAAVSNNRSDDHTVALSDTDAGIKKERKKKKKAKKEKRKRKKERKEKKRLKKERKARKGDLSDAENKTRSRKTSDIKLEAGTSDSVGEDLLGVSSKRPINSVFADGLNAEAEMDSIVSSQKILENNEKVIHPGGKTEKASIGGESAFPVAKKKKVSKKRKLGTNEAFMSPNAKRLKQDTVSESLPDNLPGSLPDTPSSQNQNSFPEMSEHQRQALYHLQKLGINLPLAALSPGNLSPANLLGTPDRSSSSQQHSTKNETPTEKSKSGTAMGSPTASKQLLKWISCSPGDTTASLPTVSEIPLASPAKPEIKTGKSRKRKRADIYKDDCEAAVINAIYAPPDDGAHSQSSKRKKAKKEKRKKKTKVKIEVK